MQHSAITPGIPADPRYMAKTIVRSLTLTKCAELLSALHAEIELELQDGWQTEDGELAEGSLEGAAAETALESFELYVKSLRHPGDGPRAFGEEEHALSFAQLGLTR